VLRILSGNSFPYCFKKNFIQDLRLSLPICIKLDNIQKTCLPLLFSPGIQTVVRHVVMRANVEAPVKPKEFEIHPKMIDSLFVLLIYIDKNT